MALLLAVLFASLLWDWAGKLRRWHKGHKHPTLTEVVYGKLVPYGAKSCAWGLVRSCYELVRSVVVE